MKKHITKLWNKFNAASTPVKAVLVIVIFTSLWMLTGALKGHDHNKDDAANLNIPLKTVNSTAEIRQKKLRINGVTTPNKLVELKAEIDGKVMERVAAQGAILKKNSPIILIDPKNNQENLQEKKSTLSQKTVLHNATVQLFKKGLSSKAEIAKAMADLKQAESDYKSALIRNNNSTISAPFDGILDTIYVDEGELITQVANKALCRFLSISPLKVSINIPEKDVSYAKAAKEAFVYTLDHKEYKGKITFLSKAATSATRAFLMEVELENKDHQLLAGESVYVVVPVGEFKTHKLPLSVITVNLAGDIVVKTLEGKKVVAKPIQVIDEQAGEVWVAGLNEQEKVITMGGNLVKEGQELAQVPE